MNPTFYQKFWGTIGNSVVASCQPWFQNSVFAANLNDTTIVLIPKNDKLLTFWDLRPISLCNVIYKTMAKVIDNRLKPLLDSIISPTQLILS